MEKAAMLKRLWHKSVVDATTDCWLWQGAKLHGHGVIRIDTVLDYVHRVSARIHGMEPDGLTVQVNHQDGCPNLNCWNPEHIYVGTKADNIKDAIRMGRNVWGARNKAKTHCPKGHPYDEKNTHWYRGRRYCRSCQGGKV